jgi:hypothetical protein
VSLFQQTARQSGAFGGVCFSQMRKFPSAISNCFAAAATVLPPRVTRGNGISFELCCECSSFSRGHETPTLTVFRVMVVSVRLGEAHFYLSQGVKDVVVFDPLTLLVLHVTAKGAVRGTTPQSITLACGCIVDVV